MPHGKDEFDALAYALVETAYDFDAVERDGLRAAWTEDNTEVVVVDEESGEEVVYSGEDLVRATSDREVNNARQPESG